MVRDIVGQIPDDNNSSLIGGALNLQTLGDLLRIKGATAYHTTSTSTLILDSAPAHTDVRRGIKAFTAQIKFWPFKIPFIIGIVVASIFVSVRRKLFGTKDIMGRMRDALQVSGILPWLTKDTPRLYIYSTKDELIPPEQIEEHAEEARDLGFNVRLEKYTNSAHVSHARTEPARYWASVKDFWDNAG